MNTTEPHDGKLNLDLLVLPAPEPEPTPEPRPIPVIAHEHQGRQLKWSAGRVCVWKVGIAGDSEESFAVEFENKDGVITQILLTENAALSLCVLIDQVHQGD